MFHRRLQILLCFIPLPVVAFLLSELTAGRQNCNIALGAESAGSITFSRDVAPIFFKNCAICHRPGQVAPMSLLTYSDARPWARSIKEKVLDRTMPPWHADPAYGKFRNDRRLSKDDIDTIVAWVDGGAPEGNPKNLPPPPGFTEGWKIGKPDVVLTMPVKFDVPAQGVLDYKYFRLPTHFTEDRWVQAAEVRVGSPAVVHHVIVFVENPHSNPGANQDAGLESLTGVAPGEEPVILPDGVGMLVRAGSVLVFQIHYTPSGVAQSDQTSVGMIFSKKPVVKAAMGGAAINSDFAIPPGDPRYEVRSSYEVDADCHITSLMPHMHVRGRDFQYRLVYPDGSSRIILSVPRYDFNWQTRYQFAESVAAPKGSRIDCVAHFNNSSDNKANPDPARLVRWGPQTWDEMMIGFIEFTLDHQRLQPSEQPVSGPESSKQSVQHGSGDKSAERKPAAVLPTIEQILDKYIHAMGGRQAVQAPTSRFMRGTISAPSIGADGTVEIYAKAPNKELTEIQSGILGSSRTGFNGTTAWEEENDEPRDLAVYPRREADFYLPLKLQEVYPRIELKGQEKIRNCEAYVLEAPRGGNPRRWYFDTNTGLLIRTENRDSGGALRRREDYEDYRAVDGIQVPFTTHWLDEDGIEIIIKFTEVKNNVPIDDSKFEKPVPKTA